MRISDWSSDVCSSDLVDGRGYLARDPQGHQPDRLAECHRAYPRRRRCIQGTGEMGRSDRKADCPDSPASGLEHVASVRTPWVLRLLRPTASPFVANGPLRSPLPPPRASPAPVPPPLHRLCPPALPPAPPLPLYPPLPPPPPYPHTLF